MNPLRLRLQGRFCSALAAIVGLVAAGALLSMPAALAVPDGVGPTVNSADQGSEHELDEDGVPWEDRARVLGGDWASDDDTARVVVDSADGPTVMSARASEGYAWEVTARLPVPVTETDLWVSNECTTSSGDFMAVVYSPRGATNDADSFAGGARAAVVDLRSGDVRDLGAGYTISYSNPGCGAGDTVTLVRFENDFARTRIAVVDATTGEVAAKQDAPGTLTSATSLADGTILAASGGEIVRFRPGAKRPERVVKVDGTAYGLSVDERERLAYMTLDDTRATTTVNLVPSLGRPSPRAVASGPTMEVGVRSALDGGFLVTGGAKTIRALPSGMRELPDAGPDDVVSSSGRIVVDSVTPAGMARAEESGVPSPAETVLESEAQIAVTVPDTGEHLEFRLEQSDYAGAARAVDAGPSSSPGEGPDSTSTTGEKVPRQGSRSIQGAHSAVDEGYYCAVPRNDPHNQAYQPKPRQVEWAVNRAVEGSLLEVRYENWRGLGMPEYSAQEMFPPVDLVGGGEIPDQVVLGILMQESNLWQASRYTAPGNTGNPLIGDFYGYRSGNSIWDIDYEEADCGYGVGQITDGMRKAGHERTDADGDKIEQALPFDQQRAIALDYTANIAMTVRMLGQKWNELAEHGILANGGDSQYIENWFMVTWAYNSGFHPYVDDETPWGVGWFNNPVNSIYPPHRTPFLAASQEDAANPQDWPYPEKILGWAAYGTTLAETRFADPETRTYPSRMASSFRTAWWGSSAMRIGASPNTDQFCDLGVNDCDPGAAEPCTLSTSSEHYYECWWHEPVEWRICERECGKSYTRFYPPSSYASEVSSMSSSELDPLTVRSSHLPNCQDVPSGTVVVDDTLHDDARNMGECVRQGTSGWFDFTYGTTDVDGNSPAKVDLHQQGGGFNAHFYFAHMQHGLDKRTHITGTWHRDADMAGTWTRVWVHVPDYAAWTQQAAYTVHFGDGTSQTRTIPQRRYANEWVSLGVFEMKGSPSVSLTNVMVDSDPSGRFTEEDESPTTISGIIDVAWDAVGFEALPGKPADFVVGLGDSFASGEGADDYAPWSDNNGRSRIFTNSCHQSANSWLRRTTLPDTDESLGARDDNGDADLDLHQLACSGAESENVLPFHTAGADKPENAEGQSGMYGQNEMVSQLDAGFLDENTTLVTLSIGGNDMRFSGIIAECVIQSTLASASPTLTPACWPNVLEGDSGPMLEESSRRLSDELPATLETVIEAVLDRAPHAQVAVMGYPKLFESGTSCVLIDSANQQFLNDLAVEVNSTISQVVDSLSEAGATVHFVDPQVKFSGHNLCTDEPAINGLEGTVTPAENPIATWLHVNDSVFSRTSVHPNQLGTSLYEEALEDAMKYW